MSRWIKYSAACIVVLGAFALGWGTSDFFASKRGASLNAQGGSTSSYVTNFRQREMNAAEVKIFPNRSYLVLVDLIVKNIGDKGTGKIACVAPRKYALIDKDGNKRQGMSMISSLSSAFVRPGESCVFNYAFSVAKDRKVTQDWALLVDGERWPKMNAVEYSIITYKSAFSDPRLPF